MAVPTTMLLDWEKGLIDQLARNEADTPDLLTAILDEMPSIWQGDDLDQILAAAERLVILARKAVDLRDTRREDRARAEWGSKDSHPDCP